MVLDNSSSSLFFQLYDERRSQYRSEILLSELYEMQVGCAFSERNTTSSVNGTFRFLLGELLKEKHLIDLPNAVYHA